MRGKACNRKSRRAAGRITPAYAGKSDSLLSCRCGIRDHPRLCGEKPHTILADRLSVGSPPPMRGKGSQVRCAACSARITPAYAGKRKERTGSITQSMDHPRLCGEKPQQEDTRKNQRGSPPPMRGKVTKCLIVWHVMRITPAYAGKRSGS